MFGNVVTTTPLMRRQKIHDTHGWRKFSSIIIIKSNWASFSQGMNKNA